MGDLKEPRWMYLKAILFTVIGTMSVAGLLIERPDLRTALLLGLAIWSFCRLYYFAFYVIEHYIDSEFKFAGLSSFVAYLWKRRR